MLKREKCKKNSLNKYSNMGSREETFRRKEQMKNGKVKRKKRPTET